MRAGEIIIFTSGAGQHYHIEAVARVQRDFTDHELSIHNAQQNVCSTPLRVRAYIGSLVTKGSIQLIHTSEYNCDQTRSHKISIKPLDIVVLDKLYSDGDDDNPLDVTDDVIDADHESGPPGFRREVHKKNSRSARQRLCGVDVDHVNKAVTLIFTNGPEIKIEGVDFLRDDNIQALRNLIAIVCPEQT